MSKTIQLSKGYETVVDDADYDFLSQWKWHYGGDGYAVRSQYIGMEDGKKRSKTILMHRLLLNAPADLQVDHANHNKLDNQRRNLRLATQSQNRANTVIYKRKNTELPIGITYNPSPRSKQPFMARVCKGGKSYFLGNFYTVEEAVTAYKAKKTLLFGAFAPTEFTN